MPLRSVDFDLYLLSNFSRYLMTGYLLAHMCAIVVLFAEGLRGSNLHGRVSMMSLAENQSCVYFSVCCIILHMQLSTKYYDVRFVLLHNSVN